MIQLVESNDQKSDVFNKLLPEKSFQYIMKLLVGWWLLLFKSKWKREKD